MRAILLAAEPAAEAEHVGTQFRQSGNVACAQRSGEPGEQPSTVRSLDKGGERSRGNKIGKRAVILGGGIEHHAREACALRGGDEFEIERSVGEKHADETNLCRHHRAQPLESRPISAGACEPDLDVIDPGRGHELRIPHGGVRIT